MMLQEEQQRFLRAINQTRVASNPFPHAIIDGALSESFLNTLYLHLPDEQAFHDQGAGLRAFQIWDGSDDMQQWQGRDRAFWHQSNTVLFNQEVATAIHRLFTPALRRLYTDLFAEDADARRHTITMQPWQTSGAINIREPGSTLPTHMDWPNRLYSLVLYLAPHDKYREDWGTRLFRGARVTGQAGVDIMAKRRSGGSVSREPEQTTLIPFKPGRIVIFMNTPWSYHGAQIAPDSRGPRWCLVKGINMTLAATEQLFGLPPELT